MVVVDRADVADRRDTVPALSFNVSGAMTRLVAFFIVVAGLSGTPVAAQAPIDPSSLWADATLYRDSYGTPHVHASTVRAMAFAFGYAQADDHLDSMLMAYRVALGRAAAVGGESFAQGDAFSIKIANEAVSRTAMVNADDLTRDLCEGFALGINMWIFDHQEKVAPWVEGVQPMDVLAYWHYLMVTSAPFDLPGIYHPERPFQRANAWALAPSNTVNGKTLLVMNPHQYYRAPYQWYEAHLMVGDINWSGATLLGVPVLMMGHNATLGWALTPNEADTADFVRERLDRADQDPNDLTPPSIMSEIAPILSFMSTAKPYYVRTNTGLEERVVPSYVGNRGPILEGSDGNLFSWRNGAYGQFGGLAQLFRMAQSPTQAAFQNAMLMQQLPCFQVLYADSVGNIFYLYNARLGNRAAAQPQEANFHIDWTMPVDAGRDRFAWGGLVPPSQLPYIANPASGYLQACGTPPWLATSQSGLDAAAWPEWLVPENSNYRGFRVRQILSAGQYSPDDMIAMLYDTLVPAAADMVPLLLSMAEARPDLIRASHPDLITGLSILKNWNFTSDRNSEALVFYDRWWTIMKARHGADFASEVDLYRALLSNSRDAQAFALAAANDAARNMRNDINRLAVPWGDVHRLQRGSRNEPFFGTDVGDPIFSASSRAAALGRSATTFGYGYAMVVEFGTTPRAMSIVPFGASENPASPHFSDQMPLFLDRRMKAIPFSYDDVTQQAAGGYGRYVTLGTPDLDGYCMFSPAAPVAISLETVAFPPRPYPSGHVPFTTTIRPVLEKELTSLPWELEWQVPETVCKPANLPQLKFYTYTQDGGWKVVLRQRLDTDRDVFTASGSAPVMMALMGPPSVLEKPDAAPTGPVASTQTDGGLPTAEEPSGAFVAPEVVVEEASPSAPEMAVDAATAVDGVEGEATVTPPEENAPEASPETPQARPMFEVEYLNRRGEPMIPSAEGDRVNPDDEAVPEQSGKVRGFFRKLRGQK